MTGEVLDLIDELRTDNRALLLVSHEMPFVRHTADLVAGGTIAESAPASAFFDNAKPPPPASSSNASTNTDRQLDRANPVDGQAQLTNLRTSDAMSGLTPSLTPSSMSGLTSS